MPAHTAPLLRHTVTGLLCGASLVATCALPHTASAAFETLHYPSEPLPFACSDVRFERSDRREQVAKAIREMVQKQIATSKACSADAKTSAIVELLNVQTTATVASDGTTHGRADILYRVRHPSGHVILNDRIHTQSTVDIQQALHLQQSSKRAARHRAFASNVNQMLLQLGYSAGQEQHPNTSPSPLPRVELAHQLETPERTQDFATRIAEALALGVPQTATPDRTYHITGLKIRQIAAQSPDAVAADVQLRLALETQAGTTIWQGTTEASASIQRIQAHNAGYRPIDTAIAEASQAAIRKVTPDIAHAHTDATRTHDLIDGLSLPYSLTAITRDAQHTDPGLVATVQNWSHKGGTFAQVWQGASPVSIRIEALHAEIRPTGKGGIAEVAGTYSILSPSGDTLMITRRNSKIPFQKGTSAADTRTASETALRFGLMESWASMLRQIQNSPPL